MLFIYGKGGYYQPYSQIPKETTEKYAGLYLLLSPLGGMLSSTSSNYYFSDWESAG